MNVRGYGESSAPEEIEAYRLTELAAMWLPWQGNARMIR
jgi:hypothetical protein